MTRSLKVLALAGAVLFAALPGACGAPATPLDMCDLKPVFADRFDTMSIASRSIGPARWIAHTPWNGDFGDAAFSDPGPFGPFQVANGALSITAARDPEGHWHSGMIAAGDAAGQGSGVRYGYSEARMKLPPGPGTWPAFWLSSLQPQGAPAPGVEIDVIEYYGRQSDKFSSALHVWYADKSKNREETHWTDVPANSLIDGFHTYGVLVGPSRTTFYLDREPIWEIDTPPELKAPMFPLLDLALGSGWPIDKTPNPSVLEISEVGLYVLDPAGRAARCGPGGSAKP